MKKYYLITLLIISNAISSDIPPADRQLSEQNILEEKLLNHPTMRFISQAIMNHDLPHTISCITPDGEFFCPESCTEHLKLDVIRLALFKKEELEKELTKVDIGYIHHTQPNLITTARTNFSNAQEIYNIVKKAALHERTKATTR